MVTTIAVLRPICLLGPQAVWEWLYVDVLNYFHLVVLMTLFMSVIENHLTDEVHTILRPGFIAYPICRLVRVLFSLSYSTGAIIFLAMCKLTAVSRLLLFLTIRFTPCFVGHFLYHFLFTFIGESSYLLIIEVSIFFSSIRIICI